MEAVVYDTTRPHFVLINFLKFIWGDGLCRTSEMHMYLASLQQDKKSEPSFTPHSFVSKSICSLLRYQIKHFTWVKWDFCDKHFNALLFKWSLKFWSHTGLNILKQILNTIHFKHRFLAEILLHAFCIFPIVFFLCS